MMIIEDNRCLATYARTNRRIQWKYAEWCGRWATKEDAIASVKEHFPNQRIEYRIEDRATGEITTGYTE